MFKFTYANKKSGKVRNRLEEMERLLSSANELSNKVENNEVAAGELLKQCEGLQQQLKAMRQVSCLYRYIILFV